MTFSLNSTEQQRIDEALARCTAQTSNSVEATSVGNWSPFYVELSSILKERIDGGMLTGAGLENAVSAKL